MDSFKKEEIRMNIRSTIEEQFSQVAKEQGRTLPPLTDDLELLNSGLDSLCFAIVVARLEGEFGTDPFSAEEETVFPTTFGEFIHFYENAAN